MQGRMPLIVLSLAVLTGLEGETSRGGEPVRDEIVRLVADFGSTDFDKRSQAYQKLVLIGTPALPASCVAAKDEDLEVARRAKNCFEEIERVWHREYVERELGLKEFPDLLRATRHEQPYVRHSATCSLFTWNKDADAVAALLRLLQDGDVRVRRETANTSRNFLAHRAIVRSLLLSLKDKDEGASGEMSVPRIAATSIGCMPKASREIKEVLIESAETGNNRLRYGALRAVGQLARTDNEFTPEAVKILIGTLKSKDVISEDCDIGLRAFAAGLLGSLKADAQAAVPDLMEALTSDGGGDKYEGFVRQNVLFAWREIGPPANVAIPHLANIARNDALPEVLRRGASDAIKAIDPQWEWHGLPVR